MLPRENQSNAPLMSTSATPRDAKQRATGLRTTAPAHTTARWGAACAECAKTKSRCYRSESTPGAACDRCQRFGKACVEKAKKPRKKRQAKPSAAQLEERLNDLVRALQGSKDMSELAASLSIEEKWSQTNESSANALGAPEGSSATPVQASIIIPFTYNSFGPQMCICRPAPGEVPGSVDSDDTLLSIFREELVPVYPFVVIPESMTARDLRETRPFVMSCIRMVASFRSLRSMQGQMFKLKSYVAEHMIMRSERSLDLLAGLIIMLGWHHYHCVIHAQVHNLISLVGSLVADLGLKRPPSWRERTNLMVVNLGEVQERTNEQKRLLLAAWYLSSSVSVDLQELEPMTFSPYMERCLHELEAANEYETDSYLVQLIRIQYLSGKIFQASGTNGESVEDSGKAPFSAYVPMFEKELSSLCKHMPKDVAKKDLIRSHVNNIRLRLHEPPGLSATSLPSISDSLTRAPMSAGVPSHLDLLYQSAAAIQRWYEDWLKIPTTAYHTFPLATALQVVYAVTMLGRWAKLMTPRDAPFVQEPPPPDPSGTYNDPPTVNSTPEASSSAARSISTPNSSVMESGLAPAIAKLKLQLASQPGLSLDVSGLLDQLCHNMMEASDELAAKSEDPERTRHDVWSLTAAKLRIAKLKLEQWRELVDNDADNISNDSYDDDDGDDDEQPGNGGQADRGISLDTGAIGNYRDLGAVFNGRDAYTNEVWLPNNGMNGVEAPFDALDPWLWMDIGEDWGQGDGSIY